MNSQSRTETTSSYTPLLSNYLFWEHGCQTQVHEQTVIEPAGSKGHFLLLQTCWPGLTEHRASPEQSLLICFFPLLIRPERVTLGLHAWLGFHYPPCRSERHKPDCLCFKSDVSREQGMGKRWRYRKGEWKRNQCITEQGSSGSLRLSAEVYDSEWNEVRKIYGFPGI